MNKTMFVFSDNLCTSEGLKNPAAIKNSLKSGVAVYDVFLLCVEQKSHNLLEIIPSCEIFKAFYSSKRYIVIGLADGRQSANALLLGIVKDFVKTEEDFGRFKNYVLAR